MSHLQSPNLLRYTKPAIGGQERWKWQRRFTAPVFGGFFWCRLHFCFSQNSFCGFNPLSVKVKRPQTLQAPFICCLHPGLTTPVPSPTSHRPYPRFKAVTQRSGESLFEWHLQTTASFWSGDLFFSRVVAS